MRFIAEYHRKGRLSKGINCTFIVLNPKIDIPQCLNDLLRLISPNAKIDIPQCLNDCPKVLIVLSVKVSV